MTVPAIVDPATGKVLHKELRIDTHTHILPESWPSFKDMFGYGGWVQMEHIGPGKARMYRDDGTPFREVEDNLWNLETRIADSDAVGVDVHVLSTVPVMFSYWAKGADALVTSQMLNDHISRCVKQYPQRFIGEGRAEGGRGREREGERGRRVEEEGNTTCSARSII